MYVKKRLAFLIVIITLMSMLACLLMHKGALDESPPVLHFRLPLCPATPSGLIGQVIDNDIPPDRPWAEIDHTGLAPGGRYSPKECRARFKVAIIIPHRNRLSHLRSLLSHMHPIWKRQQIDYRVYVITQQDGSLFNRGKLLNVGVAEASRDRKYDCYVLHDVDKFLENDHCLYWCDMDNPRHLSVYSNKHSYMKLSYSLQCSMDGRNIHFNEIQFFGGVLMTTLTQFKDSNGFSNIYWGWGGEDDDSYIRVRNKNYNVVSPYGRNCSYRWILHERDVGNAVNPGRLELLKRAHERMEKEGYNNLRYEVVSITLEVHYTNITVNIGQPSPELKKYMRTCSERTGCRGSIPLD